MKILSHFTYATAAASRRGNGVAARRSFRPLYGESIRIVEVGPRDGLQNEPKFIESNVKVRKHVAPTLPCVVLCCFECVTNT